MLSKQDVGTADIPMKQDTLSNNMKMCIIIECFPSLDTMGIIVKFVNHVLSFKTLNLYDTSHLT